MKCQRCHGLMVRDQIMDPDGPYLHIHILRCVNCGETVFFEKKGLAHQHQPQPIGKKKSKAA